jgi:hypothetical protein
MEEDLSVAQPHFGPGSLACEGAEVRRARLQIARFRRSVRGSNFCCSSGASAHFGHGGSACNQTRTFTHPSGSVGAFGHWPSRLDCGLAKPFLSGGRVSLSAIFPALRCRVAGRPRTGGCSRSNAGEPTGLNRGWSVARRPRDAISIACDGPGDEPLSAARRNKLATPTRSKPSKW